MKPILEVAYLTSDHGSTLDKCSGCKICDRIAELREMIDPNPLIKYKHLLDKGRDLKLSEVRYLMSKGIDRSTIRKHMKMGTHQFNKVMENHGLFEVKKRKVVEEDMGTTTKFNMTKEKAEQLKAEGKNKSEIAKIAGVSLPTFIHHEKKWNGDQPKKVAPLKVKDAAPVRDYAEYTTVMKEKLKHSEQIVEQKDKLNRELADKNIVMAAENVQLSEQNKKLTARIEQLEQEKMDLHAAANDTEKEAAAALEYLKREEKLMIDLEDWKLQALQYKAENERLSRTLIEERQDKDKYKGDSILFRSVLKAVL